MRGPLTSTAPTAARLWETVSLTFYILVEDTLRYQCLRYRQSTVHGFPVSLLSYNVPSYMYNRCHTVIIQNNN